ncbi:MAG: hypothetical protein FJY66_02480 [Calditrichaeota bacterium]|nr:hypothetical protein [Calditrichota bacterium]
MGRKAKTESSPLADEAVSEPLFYRVVGQKAICASIRRAIENARIAHAYLFSGSGGVGKGAVSLDFAAALLCDKFDSNPEQAPCRTCAQCRLSYRLQHPDLHIIAPVPGKAAIRRMEEVRKALASESEEEKSDSVTTQAEETKEDIPITELVDKRLLEAIEEKAQEPYLPILLHFPDLLLRTVSILIEQIRILIRQAYRKPFQARRKVFILFHADRMNLNTQNAFLKVLEDPPPDTHFLLASEGEGALLPTIQSRCQRIAFPPILEADIEEALAARFPELKENAAAISRLAGGSFWQASELAKADWGELQTLAVGYLANCSRLDALALENFYERLLSEEPSGRRVILGILLLFISDIALLKAARQSGQDVTRLLAMPNLREKGGELRSEKLVRNFPEAQPERAAQAIHSAVDYIERGYTPHSVLTALSFRLHHALGPKKAKKAA